MTAVATASRGASWAPPLHLDKDAAVDRAVRLATGLTLWLSLLLVTYWWVANGGVADLASWESGLTSLGRITGLWSADLLLLQVLLMSRLPPLEHAFGRDRLGRIHRVVGLLSFDLLITHIVLIIAGYASGQWSAVLSTIWDLITNFGGILLAFAGTACLVMVVITSIKAARRRLRYESWHLLHLYGYLGAGLALPHQLWTGQEFLQSSAATVYWWTLWAADDRSHPGLAYFVAAVAQRALSAAGRRGGSRIVRRGVGLLDRASIRPAATAGRAIHEHPIPEPAGMDPRQPILAIHRAQQPHAADHRKSPGRRQHTTCVPAAGDTGAVRGPVRTP